MDSWDHVGREEEGRDKVRSCSCRWVRRRHFSVASSSDDPLNGIQTTSGSRQPPPRAGVGTGRGYHWDPTPEPRRSLHPRKERTPGLRRCFLPRTMTRLGLPTSSHARPLSRQATRGRRGLGLLGGGGTTSVAFCQNITKHLQKPSALRGPQVEAQFLAQPRGRPSWPILLL